MMVRSLATRALLAIVLVLVALVVVWRFAFAPDFASTPRQAGTEQQASTGPASEAPIQPDRPGVTASPFVAGSTLDGVWRRIPGRVVAEDGKAIGGARVIGFTEASYGNPTTNTVPTETITDAAGRFALDLTSRTVSLNVIAEAEGYAPAYMSLRELPRTIEIVVTMRRGAALRGRVVNPDGTAIPDAQLVWKSFPHGRAQSANATHSGKDGEYSLAGLPNHVNLDVRADGYLQKFIEVRSLEADRELTIVMSRGVTVTGRVLDAESRQPLSHVNVEAWRIEGARLRGGPPPLYFGKVASAHSDALGRFTLQGIPVPTPEWKLANGSEVALWIDHAPLAPVYLFLENARTNPMEVGDIVLSRKGSAHGRVVDANGKGIEGLRVYVANQSVLRTLDNLSLQPLSWEHMPQFPAYPFLFATTDSEGRYRFETLHPSIEGFPAVFQVTARVTQAWSSRASVVAGVTASVPDIVIKEDIGAQFFGRVIDSESRAPLSEVRLHVDSEFYVVTDHEGRFVIPLFPGPRVPQAPIQVIKTGFVVTSFLLSATQSKESPFEVVMSPSYSIAGRVVDSDGRPVAACDVRIVDGKVDVASTIAWKMIPRPAWLYSALKTNAQGEFNGTGLPRGPYHVVASITVPTPPAPSAFTADVPHGASDVVVKFDMPMGGGKVVRRLVRVLNARTGRAPAHVDPLTFQSPVGSRQVLPSLGGGIYALDLATEVEGVLTVPVRGHAIVKRRIEKNDVGDILIEIPNVESIRGTLLGRTATNPLILQLVAVSSGQVLSEIDVEGAAFTVFDIAPGTYRIRTDVNALVRVAESTSTIVVTDAVPLSVTLTLEP